MGLNFLLPDPLLPSICVCSVAEEAQHIGLQPQADPGPVSGPLHVSLAGQQTKYPGRDAMSAPISAQSQRQKKECDMLDI